MTTDLMEKEIKNPNEIAISLKLHLSELINLVERENNFLDQQEIIEVLRIVPIKLELVEKIEEFEAELKSNELIKSVDSNLAKELVETHSNLCHLLTINHSKLDIAKSINFRIINMISDHLIEKKKQSQNYNSDGEVLPSKNLHKHMPPITLNQKV